MHEVPFTTSQTKDLIKTIDQRLDRDRIAQKEADWYRADDFERDISALLSQLFPRSVLPGIRIFSSDSVDHDLGYEVDNLLHIRSGGVDNIVIVEAKKQAVRVEEGKWLTKYGESEKDVLGQLDNHFRTLWEYLEPIAGTRKLNFVAVVVSSESRTAQKAEKMRYRGGEAMLCSFKELPVVLKQRFSFVKGGGGIMEAEALRVSQSVFLDLLRWGVPIKELGHPELTSSVRYVERCRRHLDLALFKHFDPAKDRWVINGSAGMGKSVLLAYTAAVLSTGYEITKLQQEYYGDPADPTFEKMGFNPDSKGGSIIVMAMSQKQLENLKGWFEDFSKTIAKAAKKQRQYQEVLPEFMLFREEKGFSGIKDCRALLIDESHDIPPEAAEELAALCMSNPIYLTLACDRHQRLRYGHSDAKIIKGLDFQRKSKRLNRIYRNPAPVYLASLAIMFRWFAKEGPKVIPSIKELDEQFGLKAESVGGSLAIRMINDTHPANSWAHCVDSFPDAASAFEFLKRERMRHKDVLWVRFSLEDPDFDYEQVANLFTYHNCRNFDSAEICDKYIKGQDFPVVVIEGFPRFMERYTEHESELTGKKHTREEAEKRMWAFRRELYLCASRATTFLYFINHERPGDEYGRIREEIAELTDALSTPKPSANGGSCLWGIHVGITEERRKQDVFHDLDPVAPLIEEAPIPAASDHRISGVAVPEMEKTGSTFVDTTDPIPKNTPKELESAVPSNDQKRAQPKPQKPELKSFDALAGMVESSEEPTAPKKQSTMKPLPRIGVASVEHQPSPGNKEEASTLSDVANQPLASPKKEEPSPSSR